MNYPQYPAKDPNEIAADYARREKEHLPAGKSGALTGMLDIPQRNEVYKNVKVAISGNYLVIEDKNGVKTILGGVYAARFLPDDAENAW